MELTEVFLRSLQLLGVLILIMVIFPLYFSFKHRSETGRFRSKSATPKADNLPVVYSGIQVMNSESINNTHNQEFTSNSLNEYQSSNIQQPNKPTITRKFPKFEVFSNFPNNTTHEVSRVNKYKNWISNWN